MPDHVIVELNRAQMRTLIHGLQAGVHLLSYTGGSFNGTAPDDFDLLLTTLGVARRVLVEVPLLPPDDPAATLAA